MNDRQINSNRAVILFTHSPEKEARKKFNRLNSQNSRKLFDEIFKNSINSIKSARLKVKFDLFISTDSDLPDNMIAMLSNLPYYDLRQTGSGFLERFHNAVGNIHDLGYEELVIIGNDSPEFDGELITETFTKLKSNDAVIGPSQDGGFYLLGLRKYSECLFDNVEWQTSQVSSYLRKNLDLLNFVYSHLRLLNDIDSINDLKYFLLNPVQIIYRIKDLIESFFTIESFCLNEQSFHKLFPQLNITEQQLPPPNYLLY